MKTFGILLAFFLTFSTRAQTNFLTVSNPPPVGQAAWNDIQGGVTNFNVYYGTNSGQYTVKLATGTNLNLSITNLSRGVKYYFVATAQIGGLESPFSNEATYTPTALPASPTLNPFVILQAQAAPSLLGPWTALDNVSLAANQTSGFFRTKLTKSQ